MTVKSLLAIGLGLLILAACAAPDRQPPPQDVSRAAIPGIPEARYWGDVPPPNLQAMFRELQAQRRASGINDDTALILSGGADYGAYGAAVLNAMSDAGTRPDFAITTGVSTGALSAPFVFLGPRYDPVLRALYGQYDARQIARPRNPLALPTAPSVADTAPLARLIDAYVTPEFLAEIAREHNKGRRLYAMSTNLDAQRPVIWDLGAIAASGAPNAQQVFRDAVLASAAIPAAFSPVMVTVEANGQSWQELHVDGGVIGQVALADGWQRALLASPAQALAPERVYLIVNNRIGPEQDETTARILPIATRANSTMIKYQLRNDLLRAFLIADRRGVDIQATWIGEGFPDPYVGPFDPDHLAALYDYGYRKTIEGRAWQTTLPF